MLVTGGTQGAGASIARRFAAAGAEVLVAARKAPEDRQRFVAADLTTRKGVDAVAQAVRTQLGGVDVLIHNLGGSSAPGGGLAALTDAL